MEKVKEGDILYTTWGATMILVQFYKVMKTTPKTVVVKELKAKVAENTGFLRGTEVPTDEFTDDRKNRLDSDLRLYYRGDSIISKKAGFTRFYQKWDGKPVYFDHCD